MTELIHTWQQKLRGSQRRATSESGEHEKKMAACMQKALVSLRGAPCFSLLSLSILSSVCLRSPLSPAKTVRYSKRVSSGNLHVLPVRKRCSVSTVAGWERSARLALPCLSCSCVRCVDTFDSCDLARVASLFLSSLRSFFLCVFCSFLCPLYFSIVDFQSFQQLRNSATVSCLTSSKNRLRI